MNNKSVPAPSHQGLDKPEPVRPGEQDPDLTRLIDLIERMGAAAEPAA